MKGTAIHLAASSIALAGIVAATPAEASPLPRCYAQHLSAHVTSQGAAAGTAYYRLAFTNKGTAPCTLLGYPGVSFVKHGHQVGQAATRDTSNAARTVVLQPGGKATATLGIAEAGDWSPAACKPVTVHRLRVFAPGNYDSHLVALGTLVCSGAAHQAKVTVVRGGTR